MTTYNGERFLKSQLESISDQSLEPYELVICDDNSKDKTIEILRKFEKEANFKVKIHQNTKNLGVDKNFEQAISLCEGDLIFISDQDDYWFPKKLEIMKKFIISDDKCLLAINNTQLTNEKLESVKTFKLDQAKNFVGSDEGFISGCCTVFKKQLLQLILPFSEDLAYDSWIHFVGINTNSRKVYEIPLQFYRRHDKNSSNHLISELNNINFLKRYMKIFKRFFTKGYSEERHKYNKLNLDNSLLLLNRLDEYTKKCDKDYSDFFLKKRSFLEKRIYSYSLILKLNKLNFLKRVFLSTLYFIIGKLSFRNYLFINF